MLIVEFWTDVNGARQSLPRVQVREGEERGDLRRME